MLQFCLFLAREHTPRPSVTSAEIIVAGKLCSSVYGAGDDVTTRHHKFKNAFGQMFKHVPTVSEESREEFIQVELAAESVSQLYAIGVTTTGTLYVGCRGTDNMSDLLADVNLLPCAEINGGRLHSGFSARAQALAPEAVLAMADDAARVLATNIQRVVFCGHSLGGAVASIAALRLKVQLAASGRTRAAIGPAVACRKGLQADHTLVADEVVCCAFAAPLFGDDKIRQFVEDKHWSNAFVNIIVKGDLVPAVLRLHDTLALAGKTATDWTKSIASLLSVARVVAPGLRAVTTAATMVSESIEAMTKRIDAVPTKDQTANSVFVPVGCYVDVSNKPEPNVLNAANAQDLFVAAFSEPLSVASMTLVSLAAIWSAVIHISAACLDCVMRTAFVDKVILGACDGALWREPQTTKFGSVHVRPFILPA